MNLAAKGYPRYHIIPESIIPAEKPSDTKEPAANYRRLKDPDRPRDPSHEVDPPPQLADPPRQPVALPEPSSQDADPPRQPLALPEPLCQEAEPPRAVL